MVKFTCTLGHSRFQLKIMLFRVVARMITTQSPPKQPFLLNENHVLLAVLQSAGGQIHTLVLRTPVCTNIPLCNPSSHHIALTCPFPSLYLLKYCISFHKEFLLCSKNSLQEFENFKGREKRQHN